MPTIAPADRLTPRSALRHRPITPQGAVTTDEPPLVPRFTRVQSQTASKKALPGRRHAQTQSWHRRHPFVFLGMGMLIALALVCIGQFASVQIHTVWDNLHYGSPRTFQMDAYVGHETGNTPSHFIALNLHGRVEVVEFPGGDGSHARIYMGPQLYNPGADLIPVTLQFIDTHHNHHPDMLVQFNNSQILFHNTQDGFQPASDG